MTVDALKKMNEMKLKAKSFLIHCKIFRIKESSVTRKRLSNVLKIHMKIRNIPVQMKKQKKKGWILLTKTQACKKKYNKSRNEKLSWQALQYLRLQVFKNSFLWLETQQPNFTYFIWFSPIWREGGRGWFFY